MLDIIRAVIVTVMYCDFQLARCTGMESYRELRKTLQPKPEYVGLLLNTLWGFATWHEIPTLATWVGALLTTLTGLYILHLEQRERPSLPAEVGAQLVVPTIDWTVYP